MIEYNLMSPEDFLAAIEAQGLHTSSDGGTFLEGLDTATKVFDGTYTLSGEGVNNVSIHKASTMYKSILNVEKRAKYNLFGEGVSR